MMTANTESLQFTEDHKCYMAAIVSEPIIKEQFPKFEGDYYKQFKYDLSILVFIKEEVIEPLIESL